MNPNGRRPYNEEASLRSFAPSNGYSSRGSSSRSGMEDNSYRRRRWSRDRDCAPSSGRYDDGRNRRPERHDYRNGFRERSSDESRDTNGFSHRMNGPNGYLHRRDRPRYGAGAGDISEDDFTNGGGGYGPSRNNRRAYRRKLADFLPTHRPRRRMRNSPEHGGWHRGEQ
eukprot:CAMPEP_0206403012 /NCGR_PEP_ID=MMETSP0294-20121207/27380_1 /ASSEMBLY_ACC=CAM_ASM_000327 /TAXON_ID=39354 /ORGANISM="Heterosigma akashiwo, Strain CCMP2393" /LENGTH=168 /DNA_ID=CAMNT_0053860359 /DNA_START=309 /DNA_END=812 /DNA_ORIENTATION=-